MGKNNRARRAAKARQKARHGTPRSRGDRNDRDAGPFGYAGSAGRVSDVQVVRSLWVSAFLAEGADLDRVPTTMRALRSSPAALVEEQAQVLLLELLGEIWSLGWQPRELRRQVRISTSALVARLCELVVHADHDRRSGQSVDPRWAHQVASLDGRTWSTRGPWLTDWREREGLTREEAYQAVLALGRTGSRLGPLDILIVPPGAPASTVTIGAAAHDLGEHPMLERIRKLLAKAEATDFEEEAATFTAKAQELMTRHAIDEALIHREDAADVPRMIRVPVDAPYADAKALLLDVVARANRCRAVQLGGYHMSSVLGHTGDLGVVELLFTSLLIQAQKALTEAGRRQPGGRARSASYRSSFLLAYADRISERLDTAASHVLDEDASSSALPVLRAREAAVEDFVASRYGDTLVAGSIRGGYDYLGRAHGRQAADQARLDAGELAG